MPKSSASTRSVERISSGSRRARRPYSGYEQFDFEVPTTDGGDCFARAVVRFEEIRQSLRITRQAAADIPGGEYMSDDHGAMPPPKAETIFVLDLLTTDDAVRYRILASRFVEWCR